MLAALDNIFLPGQGNATENAIKSSLFVLHQLL